MQHIFAMSPETAVLLRVVVAYVFTQYVLKKVVGGNRRTERFLWQFIFTFIIAGVLTLMSGGSIIDQAFWNVVLIGFIAGGGTFFSWKAVHISQSRNALFTFWDDIIAMTLSFVVLHEGQFITAPIGIGMALSFAALFGFIWYGRRQKNVRGELKPVPLVFYGYVAVYSVVWGLAIFGQRYWAFHEMPVPTFLLGWYTGTLIAAALVFLFYKDGAEDQKSTAPLGLKDISATFLLAVLILGSLGLASVSYQLPQTVVQPIYFVAEMIIPSLMGLFIFHERKQFARPEWFFFGLGAVGAFVVVLNLG